MESFSINNANYYDNIRDDFKTVNNNNQEDRFGTDIDNIGYIRNINYKNPPKTPQES